MIVALTLVHTCSEVSTGTEHCGKWLACSSIRQCVCGWKIWKHSFIYTQNDTAHCSSTQCHVTKGYTVMRNVYTTNTCMCCEVLTRSVTGAEPDQVLFCQTVEDLRIQGAGHHCARTSNYRSMRHGSISAMPKTGEGVFRHRIIIM